MAIIHKAYSPLYLKIQRINNKAIDEKILYTYGVTDIEEYGTPAYKEEVLTSQISQANFLATRKDMARLLNNSLVTNNSITRMEHYNASKQISDKITKVEVERIGKNLQYVEQTLKEADLNINKYKELIEKLPTQVSRKDVLEKALETGQNYKGKEYNNYNELSRVSKSLDDYRINAEKYETSLMENREANRENMTPPNTMKTWFYEPNERTRHEGMNGQERRIGEKFEVVNDKTGDTDYMNFPHDIENDNNNCSNICNCKCFYEIG